MNSTLQAIEGYLANKADHGDELAKNLHAELMKMEHKTQTPRVLVVVRGGVADPVFDEGVDVEVFDWDNYNDDPKGTGGVQANFSDLAVPIGVPVC